MPVPNFRDYGGYPSRYGGRLVRGRLYRSGGFTHASPDRMAEVAAHDFDLIVDLRYLVEQANEPSRWPAPLTDRVMAHDSDRQGAAPHLLVLEGKATDPEAVSEGYIRYYRDLPYDPRYRPMFARSLKRLAQVKGRSVIHCTAGKDRTGTLVYLMHHILGVDPDTAMDDFLQSSKAKGFVDQGETLRPIMSENAGYDVPIAVVNALLGVQRRWMDELLEKIEQTSGSLDRYLDDMGVDEPVRNRMRANYLEQ